MACAVCGGAVRAGGRRRFCSDACRQAAWRRRQPPAPPLPTRSPRLATVYECSGCDARYLGQQRCEDCHRFCRRIGPGGLCLHCDQPIALADLLTGDLSGGSGRSGVP